MTHVLLDNSLPGGSATLFEHPLGEIAAWDIGDVDAALEEMEAARKSGRYLAGYFSYELGYALEPRLAELMPRERRLPLLWFGLFEPPRTLRPAEVATWLAQQRQPYHRLENFSLAMDAPTYKRLFDKVKKKISAGDIYQLNLTFPAHFDIIGDPASLYEKLRRNQPVAHGALIETAGFSILSVSPELFLSVRDGVAETRPMKGTAERGPSRREDEAQRTFLARDSKSRAENLMIVDLMRNDLSRIAQPGTVAVRDLFTVETYPSVHQMTSGIEARLKPDLSIRELLRAVFPPGSITGAPKIRAMELIREYESLARGVYTGCIGLFSPQNDIELNVAIRTIVAHKDGTCDVGIGSGLVADSDEDAEYSECLVKLGFLTGGFGEFDLFETMLWTERDGIYLRDRHLDRLTGSANRFGIFASRALLSERLAQSEAQLSGPPKRLRMLLARDGEITIEIHELPPDFIPKHMRYSVSDKPISSRDELIYHKTTRRELYDSELARLGLACGADEALFVNERGQLCEGTRTNIFIEREGTLLTPELSCGLLPGTLRAELLATGKAREAVLHETDLKACERVYLGNSLRGLVPAVSCAPELEGCGLRVC